MSKLTAAFSYSIGRKLIMGLTGLFLIIFLVVHLIGNFLLLVGPEEFTAYAEFMGTNPLIRISEIGLFGFFLVHIYDGLLLTLKNWGARSQRYAVSPGNKNASWFSRNMHWTGTVMLVFLILHLISFFFLGRFGVDISLGMDTAYQATGDQILYWKTVSHFGVWWYSGIYILAMVFIGFHLNHGFQSAFQTLGWTHPKYTPIVKTVGTLYAVLIPAGYAAIPLYFLIEKFS